MICETWANTKQQSQIFIQQVLSKNCAEYHQKSRRVASWMFGAIVVVIEAVKVDMKAPTHDHWLGLVSLGHENIKTQVRTRDDAVGPRRERKVRTYRQNLLH
jgi:hypothetical protein